MHPVYLYQTYQTYRKHAAAGMGEQPDGLFRNWFRGLVRDWRKRRMIAALSSMDDWLLRDIGIERSQIRDIVDGLEDHELRMRPVDRRGVSDFDGRHAAAMHAVRAA